MAVQNSANTASSSVKMTFNEDFNSFNTWNGSSGTWDTSYWWAPENGVSLWSNNEKQWYINTNYDPTASANPFAIKDGVLEITAKPADASIKPLINNYDYTSGMITTYHSHQQTYGYFEIKADLPEGKGFWPAFWLLPADGTWPPELDVMEVLGHEPTRLYTSAHSNATGQLTSKSWHTDTVDLSKGYHTYGMDWQPDKVTWYLDGKQIFQIDTPADMHKPMYMIANLAVGGNWPGSPDGTTPFPAQYNIDYIRAYTSKPTDGSVVEPPNGGENPGPNPNPGTDPDPGPVPQPNPDQTLSNQAWGDWNSKHTVKGDAKANILYGHDETDLMDGRGGGDMLQGGTYDDVYMVYDAGDRVLELANEGIDTVRSMADSYRIPKNVENLILIGDKSQVGMGNYGDNVLFSNDAGSTLRASKGDDTLFAGKGADILKGGQGQDTFVFKFVPNDSGHITDFKPGTDMIDLRQLFLDSGYKGSNPIADKHLMLKDNGAGDTDIIFDPDGQGVAAAHTITTVDHVAPQDLKMQADWWFA